MRLRAAKPRAGAGRGSARKRRPAGEPETFAWMGPLDEGGPVFVEREIVVERAVERPVIVERPVERVVEVEKVIEKPVTVEVEKIVEVEKVVAKPIVVEKEVIVRADGKTKSAESAAAVEDEGKADGKSAKKADKSAKTVVIGRGPSVFARVGRVLPKPAPVLAGAAALFAVIVGLSLMSPSGDNAVAEHSAPRTDKAASLSEPDLTLSDESLATRRSSRDPFAAKGYSPNKPKPQTKAQKAAAQKQAAATRAAAPAAAATPVFTAKLTTYSSFTPWKKARKRAGGWIDFGGKPTVKVLSVGKASALLFVVTDVEVIKDKSSRISYDKPIRQVKMAKGGVVRFSDYRNIQGDDVTYTVRFDGSDRIVVKKQR